MPRIDEVLRRRQEARKVTDLQRRLEGLEKTVADLGKTVVELKETVRGMIRSDAF